MIHLADHLRLFLLLQMEDACTLLDFPTLSEAAMAIACQQICSIKDELSLGNGVIFAKACILPKVIHLPVENLTTQLHTVSI